MPERRFRLVPGLVASFGSPGRATITDACRGRRVTLSADVLPLLAALTDWTSAEAWAARTATLRYATARQLLRELWQAGLLQRDDEHQVPPARAWDAWGPEARAFHFLCRSERYATDPLRVERALRRKAKETPRPSAIQRRRGPRTLLPAPEAIDDRTLVDALRRRRTWRHFGRRSMTAPELGGLLGLTFGVEAWGIVKGLGRVPLKTSPSGGACHPIEPYVLVNRVLGIAPGFYHYESDRHALVRVRTADGRVAIRRCLQAQPWYDRASVLVFLVPIYERTAWRYPTPRAYRSVLIEAGHLGQTLCLVATALGLAPFTTLAVDDPEIDRRLGVDGESQGVVYVVGCGTAPRSGWRAGVPLEGSAP